jgi:hypothetical protein
MSLNIPLPLLCPALLGYLRTNLKEVLRVTTYSLENSAGVWLIACRRAKCRVWECRSADLFHPLSGKSFCGFSWFCLNNSMAMSVKETNVSTKDVVADIFGRQNACYFKAARYHSDCHGPYHVT